MNCYYKRKGNIYKINKNRNKKEIIYGDISNDHPWEKYQGDNYIAKNCSLQKPIIKLIFLTDDLKIRIEITKVRPEEVQERIIYLFSIYDNNWKECRDWKPENPNYHGQLYSFSLLEQEVTKEFNEMNELINALINLTEQVNSDHIFPRRRDEEYYEAQFLSCNLINSEAFQQNPIYFSQYYCLDFFYFTNRGKINKYNTSNYKKKNKINQFQLVLNYFELTRLIGILAQCYSKNENN